MHTTAVLKDNYAHTSKLLKVVWCRCLTLLHQLWFCLPHCSKLYLPNSTPCNESAPFSREGYICWSSYAIGAIVTKSFPLITKCNHVVFACLRQTGRLISAAWPAVLASTMATRATSISCWVCHQAAAVQIFGLPTLPRSRSCTLTSAQMMMPPQMLPL